MNTTTLRRVLLGIAAVGITTVALANAAASGGEATARTKLTLMAPASAGGGWDSFAREGQNAMRENGIALNVQVVNVPGAGGTIGLNQFTTLGARGDMLIATGAVMLGAIELADSGATLDDVVPIARVADDYGVLVVDADSEIETLDDFLTLFAEDPGGTSIAGGSLGSNDHLMAGLVAREIGVDPSTINYIPYAGGGSEVVQSIFSGTVTAGLPGYNEVSDQIEAGNLRALAVTSPERLDGVDVPTFIEQGVDATIANWRGYLATAGITDEQREEYVQIIEEMRETPEWQDALERNRWTDNLMTGDEFEQYLVEQTEVTRQLVEELGL